MAAYLASTGFKDTKRWFYSMSRSLSLDGNCPKSAKISGLIELSSWAFTSATVATWFWYAQNQGKWEESASDFFLL